MFARTERLLLRPGWPEDAAALHHALANLVAPGHEDAFLLEDAQALLTREPDPLRSEMLVFARTFGAPRLVGGIALVGRLDTELRFWIARPYWGLGFATEASQAVIEIARDTLRLPSLRARVEEGAVAAGRVLGKLGFLSAGDGDHHLQFEKGETALAA